LKTPRLVLVAARAAFANDTLWLDAIARVAAALGHTSFRNALVQVRLEDPDLATAERAAAALACVRSAAPGVPVLLNAPQLDFAKLGFDGVHWRETAIPEAHVPSVFTTASIHSITALRRAEAAGASAVLYGPIWSPTWKPTAPVGLDALAEIAGATQRPVLAIGGITPARVAACRAAGAHGVAVASGLLTAPDTATALAEYATALQGLG